jgi:adenylate kinase family enzyme
MRRVVIFGRGGAGKSTLAQGLGKMLDLPVVELDKVYWRPDGRPTPAADWHVVQERLVASEKWIS